MYTELFVRYMVKIYSHLNVWDLNDLKTVISISVRSATMEEDELRKDRKKLWKTMKNTLINLL